MTIHLPFLDRDHVSQMLERAGIRVNSSHVDTSEQPPLGWWAGHVLHGPWKDAHLLLEWDHKGWRWGVAHLMQDQDPLSMDARFPLAGTGDQVCAALGRALTQPIPWDRLDSQLDTLGEMPPEFGQYDANLLAALAPNITLSSLQLLMDVELAGVKLAELHGDDGSGGCSTCPEQRLPCLTLQEVGRLTRSAASKSQG